MQSSFFSMLSRMKHINRWGLMRNTWRETLSEHSFDVAVITYGLAVIGNTRLGQSYNCERAALLGLLHDASEIITGDLPTPVKYHNEDIKQAYKQVEQIANHTLLQMLPNDMREDYRTVLEKQETDQPLWRLVKAADKISAYIKCIEEENAGNREFIKAKQTLSETLNGLALPEADIFIQEFLPSFEKTLDEQ